MTLIGYDAWLERPYQENNDHYYECEEWMPFPLPLWQSDFRWCEVSQLV